MTVSKGMKWGVSTACIGWTALGVGLGVDYFGARPGYAIATIGGWTIATGLAVAVIASNQKGFGALDRFFAEILARTRAPEARLEVARADVKDGRARPGRSAPAQLPPVQDAYDDLDFDDLELDQPQRPNVTESRRAEPEPRARRMSAQETPALPRAVPEPSRAAQREIEPHQAQRAPRRREAEDESDSFRRPSPQFDRRRAGQPAQPATRQSDWEQQPWLDEESARATPAFETIATGLRPLREARPAPARGAFEQALREEEASPPPRQREVAPTLPVAPQPARPRPAPSNEGTAFESLLDWAMLEAEASGKNAVRPRAYAPAPDQPANVDVPGPVSMHAPAVSRQPIEEGEIGGRTYRLYADLTVEVDTLLGRRGFDSMEAACRFVGAREAPQPRPVQARSVA